MLLGLLTSRSLIKQLKISTGTTGNFVLPGAPVDEIQEAENPIEIEMANGSISRSTHTCYLRIPGLPKELREAHIVPGLSHSSLTSIKTLCRGGCVVIFKDKICEVWYRGTLALTGKDVGPGGLWIMPIDERASLDEEEIKQEQNPPSIAAATVYTLPHKQQKVKCMHQTFFAMPPTTLEKAISNNQLKGFPMMNIKDIRKHLPPSLVTPKSRMKRPREEESEVRDEKIKMINWKNN